MPDILIKNTKVFFNNYLQPAEITIEDGKIAKIAKDIHVSSIDHIIDAGGALTLPAGIDVHVHFRDPGLTHKENWYSGSCSAAAGGITTVIDQPNTIPPTVDKSSFKEKHKAARRKSIIDFGINGGVTGNLTKLPQLWELGVTAFGEIFMAKSTGELDIDDETLDKALATIKQLDAIACIHAEDETIRLERAKLLKNDMSPESHSKERPNACEAFAVQKAVELITLHNTRAHFCHISTREALGVIRQEKFIAREQKRQSGITCEVAPHHLFLTNKDWARLGSYGKMNPPLRNRMSIKALVNSVNDGLIDMVASDHAPHLEFEKDVDIKSAPSGVPGVETLMPLMLAAVKKNLLPLNRMIYVTSKNPARIFGFDRLLKGSFEEGFDADLIIVNPCDMRPINGDLLHSKAGWTPYEGIDGIFPQITISRGEIVWDGEIIGKQGRGKFLEGHGKPLKIG
ncbi:MAG: dihydroorotase [Methanosarcinaceae archaeon]